MLCNYADGHYAEYRILFTVLVNVVMLSVVMLNVVMLSVIAPTVHPCLVISFKPGSITSWDRPSKSPKIFNVVHEYNFD